MSDENKITRVEKTKDPRRVEAGRRLGAMSKQYKAEKKARFEQDASQQQQESSSTMVLTLGFLTVVVLGGVYFMRRKKPQEDNSNKTDTKTEPEPKTNFVGFD